MMITAIAVMILVAAFVLAAGIGCLMLVFMMAEMLRRLSLFMLAIAGRHRPRHLEWHDHQQKNQENAIHAAIIRQAGDGHDHGSPSDREENRSGVPGPIRLPSSTCQKLAKTCGEADASR